MSLPRIVFTVAALVCASAAAAHEFWLEAPQYQVTPGKKMSVDLRNGQNFDGVRLAYFPNRSPRFETVFDGDVTVVTARVGDTPALQMTAPARDGLLIVVHEAAPSTLVYKDWDTFVRFTEHKDFPTAPADHLAAGFTKDKVKESYTRHSKALIAVGDGHGADRFMGMETEITALKNPYDPDLGSTMEIALSYRAAPRADAQIEVYERSGDGEVAVTKYRTDADGLANFPVGPGMTYLVDAVVLRPDPQATTDPNAPQWQSLWASLTFAVPAQ